MSNCVPTKRHLRETLLLYFHQKKSAAESYRLLQETYPEYVPTEKTCRWWFARFKAGDFDIEDKERPGQPKKLDDKKLKALLDDDPSQTQEELAKSLGVTQAAVSKRLKALGYIQKQESRDSYKLKPSDVGMRKDEK